MFLVCAVCWFVNVFYAGPGVLGAFAVLKFMRAADSSGALWPSVTAGRPSCVLWMFNVIFCTDMNILRDFLLRSQPLTQQQQHIRAHARDTAGH
jgi:hypothetical protein